MRFTIRTGFNPRLCVGFSKGWKETFMSGDQEPWVFRGGLTADLQVRLFR